MANQLPSPLAAALGVVPAVLDGIRRLPGRAVQLPVLAVSSALNTVDHFRREYDDLAERGERLVARLRGAAPQDVDELEDAVEDLVARTPFASAYDKAEDALEDAAEATENVVAQVAPLAGRVRKGAAKAAGRATGTATDVAATAATSAADAASTAADAVTTAADTVTTAAEATTGQDASMGHDDAAGYSVDEPLPAAQGRPDAEAPKGSPTPKAEQPDSTRIDTAASPAVVETVETAVAQVGERVLDHDELPLPDYDHMTLGSLRGRMRSLSVEQLVQVRTYEKAHADRLPIVTMLDNRIAKLSTDASAAPSGPVSQEPAPEQRAAAAAPARTGVSPATTDAPRINPPSQGDPTNPAQPR